MTAKALNCPNCGGIYNPTKYQCEYCGSYVILSNDNYIDLSSVVDNKKDLYQEDFPGIYVFGRLLGKGEKPIILGAANNNTGINSTGGKLLLTNKSLSFSAHAFNVGTKEIRFELCDISDIKLSTNFLISQSIIITTTTQKYKFVVYHGKDWIANILAAKESYCATPNEDINFQDYTVELRKLKQLLNDGIITQEEFDIKKRTLLNI